jgi:hypothetical protein
MEMSDTAHKLSKMYKFSHNFQSSSFYDDITSTMKRWSSVQDQTAKIMAGLAVYHTFNEQNMVSLKTLESNKIFHQSAYEKALISFEKKKEKAFKDKNIAKWELTAEDVKRAKVLLEDKDEAYKGNYSF